MNIKCAVFDLDGTLVDTIDDLTNSMNYALKKLNFPTHTTQQCLKMIGYGKENFAAKALPPDKIHLVDQLLSISWSHYEKNCCIKTKPYPQILQILEKFHKKGIKLAVLTNKQQETAQKIVNHYFPNTEFAKVVGETDSITPKPQPDVILKLLEEMQINPQNSILIGDSEADISTGKNANIYTVAVAWGFRTKSELEKLLPDRLIEHPSQLLDLIDSSNIVI